MKIRNGFVSNSSSSSFVVFGYELTEEQLSQAGISLDGKFPDGMGYLYSDGGYLVGRILADVHSDGDCLEDMEISIDELIGDSQKIREFFKQDKSPVILMGTRSC